MPSFSADRSALDNLFPNSHPDFRDRFKINYPPFPLSCLGLVLEDVTRTLSENIQVAPEMVALPLLSVVAACCQKRFAVRVRGDYIEPLCLYTVTIARPSERKSAVMDYLTKPLWDYMTNWNQFHAAEIADEENPQKPLTLYVDDATPEKIGKLMQENHGSLSLFSDEPDSLRAAAGLRYGKGNNLNMLLQSWSAGRVLIQRVTEDRRIEIPRAVFSIGVMSQPKFIAELFSNTNLADRGFLQRLLYCQPESKIGARKFDVPSIPASVTEAYRAMIFDLLDESMKGGDVKIIELDDSAKMEAAILFDEIESKLVGEYQSIEGWAGKLFGQIMRIAALIHCTVTPVDKIAETPIDHMTMFNARCTADFLIAHAKGVFNGINASDGWQNVRYLWDKMRNTGKLELSLSEIAKISKFRGDDLHTYLIALEQEGLIKKRQEKNEKNGKYTTYYGLTALFPEGWDED